MVPTLFSLSRIRAAKRAGQKRSARLDLWRGIALLLMVIFHAGFIQQFWFGANLPLVDSVWFRALGGAAAILFFLVSGMSSQLSFRRAQLAAAPPPQIISRFFNRSLRIWSAALLVTLFTAKVIPADTVWFGTLHFLALGNLVLLPLLWINRPSLLPPLAIAIVVAGILVEKVYVGSAAWLWLGLTPPGFRTLDYYPLLPWSAALLAGSWVITAYGKYLAGPIAQPLQPIAWLGRHSLAIYLLHVPVLIALMSTMAILRR